MDGGHWVAVATLLGLVVVQATGEVEVNASGKLGRSWEELGVTACRGIGRLGSAMAGRVGLIGVVVETLLAA